ANTGPDEAYVELARRYFDWIAPATLGEFQWFSGLGAKAAKAAIEPLGLVPLAPGDPRLMHREQLDAFRGFAVPRESEYVLVSSIDGMTLLRRDVKGLLAETDVDRVQSLGGLTALPSHAIFDRGRLVGLWEYDTATQEIAWTSFVKKNAGLERAVKETETYVREQLGDARSFSLDSPKSRGPRIAALRKAAAS
ncbi:MAG TPA: crosslink repair DNA glycosylase YcaQ family protein, partial [Bryobacteraceae bacterium]|nr:crosslink repair DNA glycosylase YcaQ family protein [Bryobacteraceae bacterium]